MKVDFFTPLFVDTVPNELEADKIYISKEYDVAIHLCACGCNQKTVTPLGPSDWTLTENENGISLHPSIGNFAGENPYHAHYWIKENKVIWSN